MASLCYHALPLTSTGLMCLQGRAGAGLRVVTDVCMHINIDIGCCLGRYVLDFFKPFFEASQRAVASVSVGFV